MKAYSHGRMSHIFMEEITWERESENEPELFYWYLNVNVTIVRWVAPLHLSPLRAYLKWLNRSNWGAHRHKSRSSFD